MDIKEIQAAIKEMHSLKLHHGNEYTQVQQRLEAFRKHAGTAYTLDSEILQNDTKTILIKASIADKEGRVIATGLAEELRGSSNVNKTSAIENCETSAWGRALANLGLHGGKMASVEEITIAQNKNKQIDAEAEAAEKAHDEAVREEQNREPIEIKYKEEIMTALQNCKEVWQCDKVAQENFDKFKLIRKYSQEMAEELQAFYNVRTAQIKEGK